MPPESSTWSGDVLDAAALRAGRSTAATRSSTSPRSTATARARRRGDAGASTSRARARCSTPRRAAGVRRVVHTSTCATCGPVPGRPATEARPPAGVGARRRLQAHQARARAARAGGGARRARRRRRQPDDAGRPGRPAADADRQDGRRRRRRAAPARIARRRRSTSSRCEDVAAGHVLALRARPRAASATCSAARTSRCARCSRRSPAPPGARRRGSACRGASRSAPRGSPTAALGVARARAEAARPRRGAPGAHADALLDDKAQRELGYTFRRADEALAGAVAWFAR